MKRIISFMLAAVMIFSCIGIATAAGSGTITVASTSTTAGSTIEVAVSVSDNPGIQALDISISFDANYLTLIDVSNTGLFDDCVFGTTYSSPYHLTWNNMENGKRADWTGNGNLAILTFEVADDAPIETETTISCAITYAYNANKNNLKNTLSTVNGTVTVLDPRS